MKKYLVLSCETSGVGKNIRICDRLNSKDKQYYQPLSWGLIVVDENFKKIDETYVEVVYNAEYKPAIWDPVAQKVHGLNPTKLLKNGIPEVEAVEVIGSFIYEHFETGKVTLMGYNTSTFCLPFLDEMLKRYEIPLQFDYHMYDLSTLGLVLLDAHSKKEIFEVMGIPETARNALTDARNILKCFVQLRKMWNTLL